ncbi:MAG: transcriptional regulator [Pirellulales bacterium]
MSDTTRVIKPAAEELPTDVLDLIRAVSELPGEMRDRVEPVLGRVIESTKRRRRIMNLVQDALAQLRLDMKYLLFDLEATRRERDDYKKQLEDQNGFGGDSL